MRWISWHHSFYDQITAGCATATNITNFRNFESRNNRIPHIDVPQIQSARQRRCRTGPIQCGESPGGIHFMIWPLWVMLQPQTLPIFEIQNPAITEFSTLMCPQYSRPASADVVLDLFDALNLLVSSISRSDYCGLCYRNKHHQFSEFRIPQ